MSQSIIGYNYDYLKYLNGPKLASTRLCNNSIIITLVAGVSAEMIIPTPPSPSCRNPSNMYVKYECSLSQQHPSYSDSIACSSVIITCTTWRRQWAHAGAASWPASPSRSPGSTPCTVCPSCLRCCCSHGNGPAASRGCRACRAEHPMLVTSRIPGRLPVE